MSYDPEKITFFATTDARGQHVPFGIKAKDRTRHMYVIGKTGMGKSTLLENMAAQDIQNGEGMAFIDPHGSAAETLLSYIPEHRVKDVLYFAPFDMDYPVSFNIMEDVGADKRHLVVSGLMSVFEKIWVDAWSARMAYILQNTLMALLEYPDSTLLGVNRMLSDKTYRDLVVANVKDPGVKSFWVDEFAKYNERYMQEAGDAIKNKIGQFTANPVIRNIIGQPKSSFDIRKIMDEKKILIMNLSKGLIGETNANLLGSMLTTRIYLAAMSRAELSPTTMQTMPNFYFYVDEFQSFANATFANILSEARKYKLNLTIAHQYVEQMEEEVKSAVFGNVGTIVSFRVGPFDAQVLETIFAPQFNATDIVNLGFAQIYLTLMIDGIGSQPFSAVTLPPIETPKISYRDVVVASSRQQFARTRTDVEEMVAAFHEPIKVERPQNGDQRPRENGERRERRDNGGGNGNGNGNSSGNGGNNGGNNAPRERSNDRREHREVPQQPREHREDRPASTPKEPREPREQRDVRPSKEKQLDELRDVLKSITKVEVSEEGKKSHQEKVAEVQQPSAPRTELKAALQGVLQAEKKTQVPEVIPEKQSQPTVTGEASSESVPPPTPSKEDDAHTVSAKELERMMRITTSDKPPLG